MLKLFHFVGLLLPYLAISAPVDPVSRAIKAAQCRAMCLDEFKIRGFARHASCTQKEHCFSCWEKCNSLSTDEEFRSWRDLNTDCLYLPDCENPGCQLACRFHQQRSASDLSAISTDLGPTDRGQADSLLEVSFGRSEVAWSMQRSRASRAKSVVFLLLARSGNQWKELVQTPEASVVLINLEPGTLLRLLALTRSGQVDSLQTVYRPTPQHSKLVLDIQQSHLVDNGQTSDFFTYQIETPGAWLLETVSVSRDANMALAEISWQSQVSPSSGQVQYLVTWEVSGGGITGHLYTDLTSVTLSLWPEAVYNIQVELVRMDGAEESDSEAPAPMRSAPLVISTHFSKTGAVTMSKSRSASSQRLRALTPDEELLSGDNIDTILPILGLALIALCPVIVCAVYFLALRHCACANRGSALSPLLTNQHQAVFILTSDPKQKSIRAPSFVTNSSENPRATQSIYGSLHM